MIFDTGVYAITNVANGHRYIGSAVSLRKRWKEHRRQLSEGRHHSRYLQRAWNKYGPDSFDFRPVLFCDKENLISYEQAAMDTHSPEYNIAPVAGSQLGYRHSRQTRRKMSIARRRNPSSPRKGMTHTEETRKKISESRKGKGGGPRSPERLLKISMALKGRPCPMERRQRISETLTGTSTGRGQLTEDQVREVRRLGDQGLGRIRMARLMEISPSAANAVLGRHAYLWVK